MVFRLQQGVFGEPQGLLGEPQGLAGEVKVAWGTTGTRFKRFWLRTKQARAVISRAIEASEASSRGHFEFPDSCESNTLGILWNPKD